MGDRRPRRLLGRWPHGGGGPRAGGQPLGGAGFTLPITDYYRVDPISRASEVMAECSRVRASAAEPRLAAE